MSNSFDDNNLTDEEWNSRAGKEKTNKFPQYVAALLAALGAFGAGNVLSWTSPAIPYLMGDAAKMTMDEASWMSSLMPVGAVVGAFPFGILAQKFGRKMAVIAVAVPLIISWLMILFSAEIAVLYVARFTAGLSTGGVCVVVPIYAAEIGEPSVRGTLGGFVQVMFNGGILYVYLAGAIFHYDVLSNLCLMIPISLIVLFSWMPETPVYLLQKGEQEKAMKALQWLRGGQTDINFEMKELQEAAEEQNKDRGGGFKDLLQPESLKALGISVGLVTAQQFCGITAVLFYTETIFAGAGTAMSPSLCSVVVGLVMFASAFVTICVVDRFGRRVLLLISSNVMSFSLATLAVYFFLLDTGRDVHLFTWLPLFSMVLYIIVYCIGIGPLPWIIMAEIIPTKSKGLGGSIVSSTCWFLSFFVAKMFPYIVEDFGNHMAFLIFAFFCILSSVFINKVVPETRGKTLQEIQNELSGKSSTNRCV